MLEILNLMVDQCLGNLRENSHQVQLGVRIILYPDKHPSKGLKLKDWLNGQLSKLKCF